MSAASVLATTVGLLLVLGDLLLRFYDGDGYAPIELRPRRCGADDRGEPHQRPDVGLARLGWRARRPAGAGAMAALFDDVDAAGAREDLVQVVEIHPHPQRAVDLDVAMLFRTPDGGFIHRSVTCSARDLAPSLPHRFDADPNALVDAGAPSVPRRVHDQHVATEEEAVAAATEARPPARPGESLDAAGLRRPSRPITTSGPC